jgi:hypothetical protein
MKLPFDFGIKLVFRLALPGLILAIVLSPLVLAFFRSIGVDVARLEILALGTVLLGWAITLADMPIYMLYEGRRFWPRKLLKWGIEREKRRIAKLKQIIKDAEANEENELALESEIKLLEFPLGKNDCPVARYPTRIGNLITAYEDYTIVKYGFDTIFYWPRLWALLEKDLREEIDSQQAVADSSVYVSFALWISAAVLVCYAIAVGIFRLKIADVPSAPGLLLFAAGCAGAAYAIYRVSLFTHAQLGELFKALFDQHHSKLNFDAVVKKVGGLVGDADALTRPEAEKYMMVSRYLRWHRVRPPGEKRTYTPKEWKEEAARRAEAVRTCVRASPCAGSPPPAALPARAPEN